MHAVKKVAIGLALALTVGTSALASVIQTTAPAGSYSTGWGSTTLSSVTFASGTNHVLALTSTVSLADQGWGGQDPGGNQVYIGLFDNGTYLWGKHVAGAVHGWTTQTYDISTDLGALNSLNLALGGIDWSLSPTVTMNMVASPIGYPGWSLSTSNSSFSVTSEKVPEPASLALLGLGLAGLAASRRKSSK